MRGKDILSPEHGIINKLVIAVAVLSLAACAEASTTPFSITNNLSQDQTEQACVEGFNALGISSEDYTQYGTKVLRTCFIELARENELTPNLCATEQIARQSGLEVANAMMKKSPLNNYKGRIRAEKIADAVVRACGFK